MIDRSRDGARALVEGFAADLRRLSELVRASLDDVVAASKRQRERDPSLVALYRSTISDHKRGIRTKLPDRPWVIAYVQACIAIAEKKQIDLGEMGDVDYWQQRHHRTTAAMADTAPYAIVSAADDSDLKRASVLALAARADAGWWWHEFGSVVPDWLGPYLSLEAAASAIRAYEPEFVPGLLQTEQYACEVTRGHHQEVTRGHHQEVTRGHHQEVTRGHDQHELRARLRMRRQELLQRPDGPHLWAIVDVHVFHDTSIRPETMRAQVEHLIDVCTEPSTVVQIVDHARDEPALGAPVTILRFAEPNLPDVVYLEQPSGAIYPRGHEDIDHYHRVIDRLAVQARPPHMTVEILRHMLSELRTRG